MEHMPKSRLPVLCILKLGSVTYDPPTPGVNWLGAEFIPLDRYASTSPVRYRQSESLNWTWLIDYAQDVTFSNICLGLGETPLRRSGPVGQYPIRGGRDVINYRCLVVLSSLHQ